MSEAPTSKSESFKHGELVALVKWWHDGDTVPEGWTPMGPFNRGEAIENQRLRAALTMLYDKWENGDPCHEDADPSGSYIKLSFAEENQILALIPKSPSNQEVKP